MEIDEVDSINENLNSCEPAAKRRRVKSSSESSDSLFSGKAVDESDEELKSESERSDSLLSGKPVDESDKELKSESESSDSLLSGKPVDESDKDDIDLSEAENKSVDMSSMMIAPMPGMIKSVAVEVGEMVSEGQEVCAIVAMKMIDESFADDYVEFNDLKQKATIEGAEDVWLNLKRLKKTIMKARQNANVEKEELITLKAKAALAVLKFRLAEKSFKNEQGLKTSLI